MRILTLILAAMLLSGSAQAATADEDVARYVTIFNGETGAHNDAVESLAWMGISDTRLYDVIEKRLLDESEAAKNDKYAKDRVARYIRALGFSGQAKYLPTITRYLTDRAYERYAKVAQKELPQYQVWNPIISNRANFDPKNSDEANRVLNMLRADDFALKKIGAKRVYFATQDDAVLEVLAQNLRANYMRNDRVYSDDIAWMVKALGMARNPKYRPLIEEVASKAPDTKVADYAKRALNN
ncbi:MAG: hypothetical protein JSS58_11005 [Proteobacteria bacterium]|nr:hypothetical protein [Pseudomonadota bacterium]